MAPLARTTRNLTTLTAAGADLADTAAKMSESAIAAGAVIGHRVALGAQALQDPGNVDCGEFARMGTEKITALTASSQAVLGEWQSIQQEWLKFAFRQVADTVAASMSIVSAPDQALATQRRWAVESLARASAHGMRMTTLAAGLSGLALAPVHQIVTDNARRLGGRPDEAETPKDPAGQTESDQAWQKLRQTRRV